MMRGLSDRRALLLWLGSIAASRVAAQPAASAWPSRALRLVAPFPEGGVSDRVARLLAPELQRRIAQPVFVDNRPGAEGNIGCAEVAGSSDDHTLLVGNVGTHAINPLLSSHLPYDPVKDFAPISLLATVPLVLVINPDIAQAHGIRTVADLVRVAQAQPGRLLIACGSNGHYTHLAAELFKRMTQTDMQHFPHRTTAAAQRDVVAGTMDLMFDTLSLALPKMRAGKLLALAVAGRRRSPTLPDLPTVEESGGPALKGFEAGAWVGLLAPSGQPPEQLARLQRETVAALADPSLRVRMSSLGLEPQGSTAAEFAALIAAESVKWARVVRLSGVKVDR